MEDERTDEMGRFAETLDDIILGADCSFSDDFLLPDLFDACGSTPAFGRSLDGSFMESCPGTGPPDPSPPGEERSNSAFKAWKMNGSVGFVQPRKSQCLLKRCIRLLKDIHSHKIARPLVQSREMDSPGSSRCGSHYDKLAIQHVVAERRRREQMNEIFSALRALIPVSPKKGRATVLQHTKEYVIYLKSRIEELERRNRQLEELLDAQTASKSAQ